MRKSELFTMFKYPAMIKSAAFCTTVFACLAVILKNGVVLIPEVSEIRVCNIVACTFGIWCGPAGCWGTWIGNLIGDMAGSLTILSYFGCFGNFLSAWLPYKVWNILCARDGISPLNFPSMETKNWLYNFLVGGFCSVVSCSGLLAFRFDIADSMPASNTFCMIFLNNIGATLLGILFFMAINIMPRSGKYYWRALMPEEKDMMYPAKYTKRIRIIVAASVAITVYMFIYMFVNKLSLTVMDSFGNKLNVAICGAYSLLVIILSFSCRWQPKKDDEFISEGIQL